MECLYCNKEFVPKQSRQKCCCKKCGKTYYVLTHKKEKALTDKLYRESHKKECFNRARKWRQNNKQHKHDMDKKYRLSHMEKHNEGNRLWRKHHPEKNRLVQFNNYHKHKKFDPRFKLARNLRKRVREALQGKFKFDSTEKLVGCSFDECWAHLEKQFVPGMTRENYGVIWHIDHIMPCSSFDLNIEDEQRKCFNYTNLQPLFAEENLRKGSKIHWGRE